VRGLSTPLTHKGKLKLEKGMRLGCPTAGMLYQIGATEEFRYATLIILSFLGNESIPALGMKSALAQTSVRALAEGRPPGKKAVEKSRPATTDLWFKSVSRT
jgi:hypothetical protein